MLITLRLFKDNRIVESYEVIVLSNVKMLKKNPAAANDVEWFKKRVEGLSVKEI